MCHFWVSLPQKGQSIPIQPGRTWWLASLHIGIESFSRISLKFISLAFPMLCYTFNFDSCGEQWALGWIGIVMSTTYSYRSTTTIFSTKRTFYTAIRNVDCYFILGHCYVHFLILSIIISSITVFMLLPLAAQYALNWALMSTRSSNNVVTNLYLRFRFLGYLLIFQLLHCF